MLGVAGVVQDQQDALAAQLRTDLSELPVGRLRDALGRHAEFVEEPAHRLDRLDGAARVVAAQVQVELPAGVALGDAVGPVHGQGRLADPSGAGDHHEPGRQQRVEIGQLPLAAGERLRVGRQVPGAAPADRPGARRIAAIATIAVTVAATVAAQDLHLEPAQALARVEPVLLGQVRASPPVGVEGLADLSGRGQRAHQQRERPLAGRVLLGQRAGLGDHRPEPAEPQLRREPILERGQPGLLEPEAQPLADGGRRGVGQGRAVPQLESVGELRNPALVVGGRCPIEQVTKATGVDLTRISTQHISAAARLDHQLARAGEGGAQPGHAHLDRVRGGARGALRPGQFQQARDRDDTVDLQRKHRQHEALLARPKIELCAVGVHLDRTKKSNLHPSPANLQRL